MAATALGCVVVGVATIVLAVITHPWFWVFVAAVAAITAFVTFEALTSRQSERGSAASVSRGWARALIVVAVAVGLAEPGRLPWIVVSLGAWGTAMWFARRLDEQHRSRSDRALTGLVDLALGRDP